MRRVTALAVTLAFLPLAAVAQETLDPLPVVVRGAAYGGEQVMEGDLAVNIQTSPFPADGAPKGADDWLEGWRDRPGDDGGIIRRYHVRFVGRRTAAPGTYGPGGAYQNKVLIDRLISARLLIGGGPP